jgi:hypothetical protein
MLLEAFAPQMRSEDLKQTQDFPTKQPLITNDG